MTLAVVLERGLDSCHYAGKWSQAYPAAIAEQAFSNRSILTSLLKTGTLYLTVLRAF
jgi:hypothetical protein